MNGVVFYCHDLAGELASGAAFIGCCDISTGSYLVKIAVFFLV
jgi:hypothetical protein